MRTTPDYFRFRQWLYWNMKTLDEEIPESYLQADKVYQDSLLEAWEIIPATFVLSYVVSMLEDARQYFQKHAYSIKIPTLQCHLNDIENYNPEDFECDDSMPDLSTLEKTALWCPEERDWNASILFHVTLVDAMQKNPHSNDKFVKYICTTAPSWFGSQYNMIYYKWIEHSKSCNYYYIDHYVKFYHSDAQSYYPHQKDKWIVPYDCSEHSE
jgi:hypothetical protein